MAMGAPPTVFERIEERERRARRRSQAMSDRLGLVLLLVVLVLGAGFAIWKIGALFESARAAQTSPIEIILRSSSATQSAILRLAGLWAVCAAILSRRLWIGGGQLLADVVAAVAGLCMTAAIYLQAGPVWGVAGLVLLAGAFAVSKVWDRKRGRGENPSRP